MDTTFRIMIIDDNPAIHQDFIKILKTNPSSALDELKSDIFGKNAEQDIVLPKFEIDVASQGQEGVDRIKKALVENKPYSLAFVDIRMPPGWDGIETIKHIWAIDPSVQIVICTAYSDYTWEETVAELGKTDNLLILKKPFDNISVRQLACALTMKWRLAEEVRKQTENLQSEVATKTESLQKSLATIQYQATHDPLTGLVNRIELHKKLQQAIQAAEKSKLSFAVLFIDFDRFKLVNDSLSHNVGDELLREAANRLTATLDRDDILARLGGDEFVIVYMDVETESDVQPKVHRLLNVFKEPFQLGDRKVILTSSIGISLYPQNGKNVNILLRNADTAMYRAKALKGNNFQFYTDELNQQILAKLDQEIELRNAVNKNEFFLCYQPQLDLLEDKLVAVEALIRWRHPTKGVLLPIDFIPLAEETGLIVPINEWVLRAACKQNKAWQDQGLPPIRVAVNLNAEQFKQRDISELIKDILQESKLKPEFLELELTENIILSNREIIRAIQEIKKLGVHIAIDDFGTGYSSLSYLHKIPLDRLKIDQSVIRQIDAKPDEVIVRAVMAMAKDLNLEVLAEGVETIEQVNFLKKYKCADVQGFYFSKPLSITELENYLKNPKKLKKNIISDSK